MGTPTLETATEFYNLYLAAEKAILQGQAYTIGNRSLTRANLTEVVTQREKWGNLVDRLSSGNGGARVIGIIPRDA